MIYLERARTFGCRCFWCLFSQNCTSRETLSCWGMFPNQVSTVLVSVMNFVHNPMLFNNGFDGFLVHGFSFKICNDRFIQSGFLDQGLGLRRGWGRWHQWGALDVAETTTESFGNSGYRFFQFWWPFFFINPWEPEMMNFFWEKYL